MAEREQEVGLVLVRVHAAQQLRGAVRLAVDAGVVAGRHVGGVQFAGPVPQQVELEVAVAQQAGVGGPSAAILRREHVDHPGLKRLLQIDDVIRHVELLGHAPGVLKIVDRTTPAGMAVRAPREQHGNRDHLVARLDQQRGRHRAIDAAAQRGQHARRVVVLRGGGRRLHFSAPKPAFAARMEPGFRQPARLCARARPHRATHG